MHPTAYNPRPPLTEFLVRQGRFQDAPLHVLDGGSRGGCDRHWAVYGGQVRVIAFEPDEPECRRLNEAAAGPTPCRYYPTALGGGKGPATLHLARQPHSHSLLVADDAAIDRFGMGDELKQVGEVQVTTTDIDSFVRDEGLRWVDFMKLDIEGAELDALKGATNVLAESLLGLSVEVWFQPTHHRRPLFGDIDGFLRRHGFALFDLRELNRWQRRPACGPDWTTWIGAGQLMFANALYFRDLVPELRPGAGQARARRTQVLKLASLAELFGYPDFALEVLARAETAGVLDPSEAGQLRGLIPICRPASGGALRRAVRAVLPQGVRTRLKAALAKLVS